MAPIEIRSASPDDVDELRAVLTHLHEGSPWDEDHASAARETLEAILDQPDRRLLVATVDGQLVGTLDIAVLPNLTRNAHPWAIIENIVVVEGFRRLGIGRRLMETALEFATERSCYKVQLISANRRDAAHALYTTMRFDADVTGYRRYLLPVSHGTGST